jgi:hypothetical protein
MGRRRGVRSSEEIEKKTQPAPAMAPAKAKAPAKPREKTTRKKAAKSE